MAPLDFGQLKMSLAHLKHANDMDETDELLLY